MRASDASARTPAPTHFSVTVAWKITQHMSADAKSSAAPDWKPEGIYTAVSPVFANTSAAASVKCGARSVTK